MSNQLLCIYFINSETWHGVHLTLIRGSVQGGDISLNLCVLVLTLVSRIRRAVSTMPAKEASHF